MLVAFGRAALHLSVSFFALRAKKETHRTYASLGYFSPGRAKNNLQIRKVPCCRNPEPVEGQAVKFLIDDRNSCEEQTTGGYDARTQNPALRKPPAPGRADDQGRRRLHVSALLHLAGRRACQH